METNNTENFDSQNEELETTDSSNSEQDTETESTDDSSQEDSTEEEVNESKEEKFTEREKQLYAQLQKAKGFVQDKNGKWVKPEAKETKQAKTDSNDEIVISRLEARGYMESEDQDYILRFAKAEGISPIDALNDEIVKDRLKANERKRKSDNAAPRSNNRTGNPEDEVDAAVRKYERTGELPDNNPALTSKILDRIK